MLTEKRPTMLRKLLPQAPITTNGDVVQDIYESLRDIQQKMEDEVVSKQTIIDSSRAEIRMLRGIVQEKDQTIHQLKNKVEDYQRNMEGNRQLINKLLNDLERMQQDVEWYKRTYESRSLFGTIKEKIFGRGK
jgi:chromosome segregation ATPase